MNKPLIAYKLVFQRWSKAKKGPRTVIDKHTFYAKDALVLKYLMRVADCPNGTIMPASHLGIEFTEPTRSAQ